MEKRRERKWREDKPLPIDWSIFWRKRKTNTMFPFFGHAWVFLPRSFFLSVFNRTYGNDTDRRVRIAIFFLSLLFLSFLSVYRQNRSMHTSSDEGLVHHHRLFSPSSSSSSSSTICTAGCLSISIKLSTCPLNWGDCNSFSFCLSSNGYLLFALIEDGGQQQRVMMIATYNDE